MAVPTVTEIYPNDSDVGIPIGETLYVVFDRGVDLKSAKTNIILYGPDTDITSGPDSAQWIDDDTRKNYLFLKSPNFKGLVEMTLEGVYLDASGDEADPDVAAEVDEALYTYKVKITPNKPLAADAEYVLHVIGDPDGVGRGISSRTVFDVVPDAGNVGDTGSLEVFGGYTGTADTVNVKITTAGDIGTAKYKWWFASLGEGSAVTGRVASRRFRKLEDGLQIRFTGSAFVADDLYTFGVEAVEYLEANHTVTFTTNDGSYSTAPSSPSTPATSSPPSSSIPDSTSSTFELVSVTPDDGATNLPLTTKTITLIFSDLLDADTITDGTVTVTMYPVSGVYSDTNDPVELNKLLTVSGKTLTIEI